MRPPKRRRNNPKARKVVAPPPDVNVVGVAASCHYVGSPYHKAGLGFAGVPRSRRPDANMCPKNLMNARKRVQGWLRKAVRAGHTGAWERGFPRYVWYRNGAVVYEARQGSPGSGEYHGYPLDPDQRVQGLP